MTKEEILEGNKLIAEFMGFEFNKSKIIYDPTDTNPEGKLIGYPLSYLKYHSSWDWLMEVIDKIESLEGDNAFKDNPKVKLLGDHVEIFWFSTYRGNYVDWKNYLAINNNIYQHKHKEDSKILAVFKAVVEFIKWYNKRTSLNEKSN